MKIAVIHLSDFHVKGNQKILLDKLVKFSDSLNVLNNVDEYVLIISGDLTNKAQKEEFSNARRLIGRITDIIKQKNKRYVNVFVIPGNHDISLTRDSRERKDIESYYQNGIENEKIEDEYLLLDNFYNNLGPFNNKFDQDKLVDVQKIRFKDFTIQFNLINTAPFSTLEKNDKEIHYFPNHKISMLTRQEDSDVVITVMHHSYESFRWEHKHMLEETINETSEFLLLGHDHYPTEKNVNIGNNLPTHISCAGEMDFSNVHSTDSFNVICLDTDESSYNQYIFNWDCKNNIFRHKKNKSNIKFISKTNKLAPQKTFISDIKKDVHNLDKDYTMYYVFPKLIKRSKNEFGKYEEITCIEDLEKSLNKHKRIIVTGQNRSGKTLLLKNLYVKLSSNSVPLYIKIDLQDKINYKKIVKYSFEEQYGEESILYEKYIQTDKEKRIVLIDGFDNLKEKGQELLLKELEAYFDYIVLSSSNREQGIIESIMDELYDTPYIEYSIKPFFAEKRHFLVENICKAYGIDKMEYINKINNSLDSIVQNNSGLFPLTPDFLVRYINYYINNSYYDYSTGETTFNKVFEYELNTRIISITPKEDVDEVMAIFEEIAGYMYSNKRDSIRIDEIKAIVDNYNSDYGYKVEMKNIVDISINSGLLKQNDAYEFYFSNKNYFSYFVAKYLLKQQNSPDGNMDGIIYALNNICFGVNSDIILFLSYLTSNVRLIQLILERANTIFESWDSIDLESGNINFLSLNYNKTVSAPDEALQKEYVEKTEKIEESIYEEEVIEAKGLFNYDESDVNKYPYNVMTAMKYAEMICKALPSLNSVIKMPMKRSLIEAAYSYPNKIAYKYLKPINDNFDKICEDLHNFATNKEFKKKDGTSLTIEDIKEMIIAYGNAMLLGTYDHFAELCANTKTIDLLKLEKYNINNQLQRLLFVEACGDTDVFFKEIESAQKANKNTIFTYLTKLIVRKHLLVNPNLSQRKKQYAIDKLMRGIDKKAILLSIKNNEM